jgi:hypothetical protein
VVVLLVVIQAGHWRDFRGLGYEDYLAFWSAGRLIDQGQDPYSPAVLLEIQQEVGWSADWPIIMFNPPWLLPLVMPFGLLPFGISQLLWLAAHLALLLVAVDLTWRLYGGPPAYRWAAWILALSFVPTLLVLKMGQLGALVLLGVLGFLYFERRGQGWLMGAALTLMAVKPHLVYLFGLAVVFWAVERRRWSVLAGGILSGLAAVGLAMLCRPTVVGDFLYALSHHPPLGNITPTLGGVLRVVVGEGFTALQFLPTVLGTLWFLLYWHGRRHTWIWEEQAPLLLLASFLTTCYGAWVFDLVVLLLPLLQAAVWTVRSRQRTMIGLAVAGYLAINGLALAMNLGGATYPLFIWMTPALLVLYLLLRRQWQRGPTGLVLLHG